MMSPLTRVVALPRRLYASCRDFGWRFTLHYLLNYRILPAWLLQFGRLVVLMRPVQGADAATADDPEIRLATADDLVLLTTPMPPPERAHWVRMIGGGQPVWVIVRDGRLAAISATVAQQWRNPHWLLHQGRADDVWGGHMWVAPDCRGAGIAGRLRLHMLAGYARAGATRRLSLVMAGNHSSLRSQYKTGASQLGSVTYVRLFGFAVVRAGRLWRCGWCSAARPLTVPVEAYN